jgi:hypothetical protein
MTGRWLRKVPLPQKIVRQPDRKQPSGARGRALVKKARLYAGPRAAAMLGGMLRSAAELHGHHADFIAM